MREILGIRYYTVKETAAMIGRSDETIRRMCRDKRLQAKRITRALLIPEDEIKKLLGA
jgi:excisionase family DNA binding protein